MITCIVVELCAGSTPSLCRNNGSTAPRQILENTIRLNAHVTATVSGKGVWNAMARKNPAADRIVDSAHAIRNSRDRNWDWVALFSVPSARPLMTKRNCGVGI